MDAKKAPQPFSLDYTQTLLSLLDILSAFYAKLAKLLGPSPFPHASQHMLGLSPHPGVSYLFQNQTQASATDDALGGPIGGSVLSNPPPSWRTASRGRSPLSGLPRESTRYNSRVFLIQYAVFVHSPSVASDVSFDSVTLLFRHSILITDVSLSHFG